MSFHNRLFVSDNWNLFYLIASLPSFQRKHHIWSSLKKTDISSPTDSAFTVAQTDKLLLHLPTAIWADSFIAHLHSPDWVIRSSERETPYCRRAFRADASPSCVIRMRVFPKLLKASITAFIWTSMLRSRPFQVSRSLCAV